MFATRIGMEVTTSCSIKHVQSISRIAGGMTVNQIQIYCETITVCNVNQFLQLLWRSIAAA